jgi:hypothetical protein
MLGNSLVNTSIMAYLCESQDVFCNFYGCGKNHFVVNACLKL